MDVDLRRMAILATVVESGSMRRAARDLDLTPSAVSQQIRQLEREAGVTLLRRSTRRLALTEAGEAFYEGCAAMVAAARAAQARLAALQDSIAGELRLSAPVGFAGTHLTPALAPLLEAHPDLSLRVLATDDLLDVVRERIDLAVVIGTQPPASSLVRSHLADWPNLLVAAPRYLARRGTPSAPDDLEGHDLLTLPSWHHAADVLTAEDGRRCRIRSRRRVTSNNQLTIRQLTLAGCGLSFQVAPEIAAELAEGRLVRVLPAWSSPKLSVDALTPPRKAQPAKVRSAIDALRRYLSGLEPPPRSRRGSPGPRVGRR